MAADRGNEARVRRDLFMALRISQTIFFASRLFSDIHMRSFATETKARILQ